jgi:hypothetical protein
MLTDEGHVLCDFCPRPKQALEKCSRCGKDYCYNHGSFSIIKICTECARLEASKDEEVEL